MSSTIYHTDMPGLKLANRGKVRDVYDLGEALLIVATDRLSAFDVVFSDPIPGKGSVLTRVSAHWFEATSRIVKNHCLAATVDQYPAACREYAGQLDGRSMLARKAKPLPVECVVRGYLDGSAWKEYRKTGKVASGHALPKGLRQRSRLPEPIFSPATKEELGQHDENIDEARAADILGKDAFEFVRDKSLALYRFGHEAMLAKGIVLSDTKFEFGWMDGEIILIDECMTPDSSRFWEADTYTPGPHAAFSFDKQFVRDYVESIGWEKKPPAPRLPEEIIRKTSERYEKIAKLILEG
ncbi:MAG: phosphoribosylaminoimidazolesuccinocarboxamide synthase [Candidatus Sumerlaeota bacterium]|nr:phosphoribosylaminoimidazolesuccinocarboxamide synthase [Candidatus Sumerlaeota bacterium]